MGCRAVGRSNLGRPHHAGRGQAGLGNAAQPAGKPRGEAGRVGRPGRRFATGGRGIHRGERPGQDRLLRHRGPGSADRRDRRRALSADFRGDGLGVVADSRPEDPRRRAGDRQFQRDRLSPGRDRRRDRREGPLHPRRRGLGRQAGEDLRPDLFPRHGGFHAGGPLYDHRFGRLALGGRVAEARRRQDRIHLARRPHDPPRARSDRQDRPLLRQDRLPERLEARLGDLHALSLHRHRKRTRQPPGVLAGPPRPESRIEVVADPWAGLPQGTGPAQPQRAGLDLARQVQPLGGGGRHRRRRPPAGQRPLADPRRRQDAAGHDHCRQRARRPPCRSASTFPACGGWC